MMQKVNRLVYEASSSSRYATFYFAALNPQLESSAMSMLGTIRPCWSEHRVCFSASKLVAQSLGCCHRLRNEARSLILEPGDLLIAYTDGISEAMTAEDEEWGEDRMVQAVPRLATTSASEVLEEIFRAADEFTAGAVQHDDMTLLVMKLAN